MKIQSSLLNSAATLLSQIPTQAKQGLSVLLQVTRQIGQTVQNSSLGQMISRALNKRTCITLAPDYHYNVQHEKVESTQQKLSLIVERAHYEQLQSDYDALQAKAQKLERFHNRVLDATTAED